MQYLTRSMYEFYKLDRLNHDFMGYRIHNINDLSYHHTKIPKRNGGKRTWENGSILNRQTSHDYIHIIEHKDIEIYDLITLQLIDENLKGKLDIENLRKIRDYLEYFEKEHCSDRNSKGKCLIKEKFIRDRIKI